MSGLMRVACSTVGWGLWEQELLWDEVAVFFILPTEAGGSQSWT